MELKFWKSHKACERERECRPTYHEHFNMDGTIAQSDQTQHACFVSIQHGEVATVCTVTYQRVGRLSM